MPLLNPTTHIRQRELGFTLVEIMVGMVIAMLGIIIMMQMMSVFEGQKRTTTGGDDAQNSGAIALYGIQLNIQQAGYCFSTGASAVQPTHATVGALRPVMINVATLASNAIRDANTDTILVSYGNDACPPESASGVAAAATMVMQAYAVLNGNLMQCDYLATDCALPASWTQIAGDVISLKAECNANQSVRVALVTMNRQLEKTPVTAAAPTWSGATAINLTAAPVDAAATALAASAASAAWQFYRYKSFETLTPIRNTLWSGGTGC
ncbi:MAG: prepilin-type N-terminal cleavage/methylation domain-containing protein [Sideroxydans sp.]